MTSLLCFLLLAAFAEAQTQNDIQGTDSGAYVHNPEWDLTPFQLFQLRKKQQGITVTAQRAAPQLPAAAPVSAAVPAPAPVQPAAPQVQVIQQAAFQSFPAQQQLRPAVRQQQLRVQQQLPAATPAQFQLSTDFRSIAAAPLTAGPVANAAPVAAARFQPAVALAASQQTPDFIAAATGHPDPNFWSRSWSYTAPTYAAKAEGSSYTYIAQF